MSPSPSSPVPGPASEIVPGRADAYVGPRAAAAGENRGPSTIVLRDAILRLSKHTLAYSTAEYLSRIAGFLLIPLYTGYLTEADYGTRELFAITIAVLVQLAGINVTTAMHRAYFEDADPQRRRRVVSTTLWSVALVAGIFVALGLTFTDRILPIFLMQAVPVGLKGLIIAGVFAAAISSLDSILAALSQTVLTAFWEPRRKRRAGTAEETRSALAASRVLVCVFGGLLCALAVFADVVARAYPSILDLALAMAGYTQGALLAGFLLAFLRLKVDGSGFLWSAPLSVIAVFAVAWSARLAPGSLALDRAGEAWVLWTLVVSLALLALAWCWRRVAPELSRSGGPVRVARHSALLAAAGAGVLWVGTRGVQIAWPWYVPTGCLVAFVFGYALAVPRTGGEPVAA